MKTLTRSELNKTGCGNPECGHDHSDDILVLHAICHPDTPTWVFYEKVSGNLIVKCAECDNVVARLKIAE